MIDVRDETDVCWKTTPFGRSTRCERCHHECMSRKSGLGGGAKGWDKCNACTGSVNTRGELYELHTWEAWQSVERVYDGVYRLVQNRLKRTGKTHKKKMLAWLVVLASGVTWNVERTVVGE